MGKGKLSLLDVRAIVKELRAKLLGLRVANIYHLSAKTFLLRLSGTDVKETLLVESGVRMHTTKYAREHDKLPSNFCAKLRKHLRLQKLEDIVQVGNDRIVDLQFGRGDKMHHLILEFYDAGNIILTDANLDIIMLLRTHTYGAPAPSLEAGASAAAADQSALPAAAPALGKKASSTSSRSGHKGKPKPKATSASAADGSDEEAPADVAADDDAEDRVAVRSRYPMSQVQMPQQHITLAMIQSSLQRQLAKEQAEAAMAAAVLAEAENKQAEQGENKGGASSASAVAESAAESANQQGKKQNAKEQQKIEAARRQREEAEAKKRLAKPKMKQGMPVKAVLAQDLHFGPDVIEHCLLKANIDPNQTASAFLQAAAAGDEANATVFSPALLNALCTALQEAPKVLERISTEKMPAFIFWRTEQQAAAKPVQPQQQQKKPKPAKQRKGGGTELVVDEIDTGTTVAGAVAAAASSAATPAAFATSAETAAAAPASAAASSSDASAAPAPASSSSSADAAAPPAAADAAAGPVTLYTEYVPMLLASHSSRAEYRSMPAPLEYPSFDDALDEFYSQQEAQKEAVRLIKEKAQALQKLEREKARQVQQLSALAAQQSLSTLKAQLIEQNLDAVNACIGSVNAQIATGVDWRELTRMIKEAAAAGDNPIARMIHSLRLLENSITIGLSEGMAHLLPPQPGVRRPEVHLVEIDLALSAFSNAQLYFDFKKRHAVKQAKAESASAAAIKAAERKTNVALSAVDQKARIQKQRKVFWFEKFHFFISSENFLVIGGKDAQQNETLVKRYLGKNDIYVHAEVHGASSVIVKNHTSGPVPPLTLSQAGSMTICRSAAWKDKIVVEAYWVHADQVSKSAPTGLSLPTGSFMIRGRKNFLPRMPLVMGIGLLFLLDESSRARHAGERRVRAAGEDSAHAQEEDKFDQISDLPSLGGAGGDSSLRSSSHKKKAGGGASGSSKKKKKPLLEPEAADDFDVTSNLGRTAPRGASSSAVPVGRLTSEDEATDTEDNEKRARLAKLAAGATDPSAPTKPAPVGKPKMSAAQRKKLKKGGGAAPAVEEAGAAEETPAPVAPAAAPSAADADGSSSEGEAFGKKKQQKGKKKSVRGAKTGADAAGSAAASAAPAAANKPLPRGKRNKVKRAAARYANQDEEDLVLAASLLGLQGVEKKKAEVAEREKQFLAAGKKEQSSSSSSESESEQEDEKEDDKTESAVEEKPKDAGASSASAIPADDTRVCFNCKQRGHVYKACPTRTAESDITFAAARRAAANAEESAVAQLMAEEGVAPEGDEGEGGSAAQAEQELSSLTGRPLPEDLLHFILPVCAPYDALASYKYKLKLLPGAMKKGKAAKDALRLFMATPGIPKKELELAKLCPEQDVINVLCSNIKLSAPGQQDGKKKAKKKPAGTVGKAAASADE